jgi:gliding motility-associated-like protein
MLLKIFVSVAFAFSMVNALAQPCSLPGTTPDKAYPVCGISVFREERVTFCTGPNIPPAGCSAPVTSSNSIWYKFTCYQSGTLGFLISGISPDDDYDWQMFDVTGRNPTEVYTNASLMVSLNMYGAPSGVRTPFPNSPTGCRAGASGNVHCEGNASGNTPFNVMPNITVGRDYLLMVTNWTSTQGGSNAGYDLTFAGGTASITDPKIPALRDSRAICDGTQAVIRINKKMKCNSLASDGSDFVLTPNVATVIGASGFGCSTGFDVDSVILTLSNPLPPGNYTIAVKNGTDGNTVRDNCDRAIPVGESLPMIVFPQFPTPMDSVDKLGCAPDEIIVNFSKQIRFIKCNSIAANGSDFVITGTSPVAIISASGICDANGLTPIIKVKLSAPIQTKGTYQIRLQTGSDGNTIINECGQPTAVGTTVIFTSADTVNADFNYNIRYGCVRDTIDYFHDGRNDVNLWRWNFDGNRTSTQQNPQIVYATFGSKTAQLIVSNGTCRDTVTKNIFLDNYLEAKFEAPAVVCPGDVAVFKDTSIGSVQQWLWNFGNGNTSTLKLPPSQAYAYTNAVRDVPVQLIVTNNLGCLDTAVQLIKVPNNCFIAVPNAFTPNGDGRNDFLYPTNAYKTKDLQFRVFNRFGQLIFSSTNWQVKWDGKFKGQPADPATYVWILQYTFIDTGEKILMKGSTILLR